MVLSLAEKNRSVLITFSWSKYGEGPCRLFVSKGGENAASAFVGPALPRFDDEPESIVTMSQFAPDLA